MNLSDLIPVLGMIASVIAAAAVARHQIRKLEIEADKSENRIDALDIRVDKLTSAAKVLDRQVATLAGINSPENLEIRTRRMESIRVDVEWIKRKLESI
jgi:cell division protein FtsL